MLTKEEAKVYWCKKQELARQQMVECKDNSAVLIECASKVLVGGLQPDFEFCARLNRTIELYKELKLGLIEHRGSSKTGGYYAK